MKNRVPNHQKLNLQEKSKKKNTKNNCESIINCNKKILFFLYSPSKKMVLKWINALSL